MKLDGQALSLVLFIPVWGYVTAVNTTLMFDIFLNTLLIASIVFWSYMVGRTHELEEGF